MGLDTSHDCWHGAYSAFSRWRNAIAKIAGYEIVRTADGHDLVCLDWGHLPGTWPQGDWPEPPSDPLVVLIAHWDCDGVIHPQNAGPLADRLESLLPEIEKLGDGGGHIGDFGAKTRQFISGLRAAVEANEDVEFN